MNKINRVFVLYFSDFNKQTFNNIKTLAMKNISNKTLIFYSFQHNKNSEYNVTTFKKLSPTEPKIREVLYELPLDYAKNSYHFRFRSQFFEGDEKIVGWIDISNLAAKVPIINNTIYVKILKLPGDQQNKLFNRQKLQVVGLVNPSGNGNRQQNGTKNQQVKQVKTNPVSAKKKQSFNILDMSSNSDVPSKTQQKKVENNQKPYVPGSETQQEIRQRFVQQCKKQQDDQQLQKKAIIVHEQKITQWGYSGHKTINNLTTLLATMHTIWPAWQPISLADLLTPESVNRSYKKAALLLHPDKNMKKDYETRYLSKRIFNLLNQAKKAAP